LSCFFWQVTTGLAQIRYTNTANWPGYSRGQLNAVDIESNYLYAAIGIGGVAVLDISNPETPTRVASYDVPWVYDIAIQDHYAYVLGRPDLHILDISDPIRPVPISHVDLGDSGVTLFVDGPMVYVTDWYGLKVIDASDLYAPKVIGNHPFWGIAPSSDLIVRSNLAYVGAYNIGLFVVDVADPTNLVTQAVLLTNDRPRAVALKGDYAFIGARRSFQVHHLNGTNEPTVVWSETPRLNGPYTIELAGDYAYVAYADALRVFDVADPTNVVLVSSHS
jgi:hypothetical protein